MVDTVKAKGVVVDTVNVKDKSQCEGQELVCYGSCNRGKMAISLAKQQMAKAKGEGQRGKLPSKRDCTYAMLFVRHVICQRLCQTLWWTGTSGRTSDYLTTVGL